MGNFAPPNKLFIPEDFKQCSSIVGEQIKSSMLSFNLTYISVWVSLETMERINIFIINQSSKHPLALLKKFTLPKMFIKIVQKLQTQTIILG